MPLNRFMVEMCNSFIAKCCDRLHSDAEDSSDSVVPLCNCLIRRFEAAKDEMSELR
jgi:hypothetical protein